MTIETIDLVTYRLVYDPSARKLTFYGLDGHARAEMAGDMVVLAAVQINAAKDGHGDVEADYMAHGIVTGLTAAALTGAVAADLPPLPPPH